MIWVDTWVSVSSEVAHSLLCVLICCVCSFVVVCAHLLLCVCSYVVVCAHLLKFDVSKYNIEICIEV